MTNFNERTIDEIFQELLLEKQTLSSLNGLLPDGITDENSLITALTNGKVPEWVLWLYNFAVATNITDISTSTAVIEIEDLIENQIVPTSRWYIKKALEFQYGDTLIIDPTTYQVTYNPVTEANQIIGSCTTLEFSNKLVLKVRRIDTNILSAGELTAFVSYMNKVKSAGTQVEIQNFAPDQLTIYMTIQYDGNLDLATVTSDVEVAINDYIENIQFDSRFISNTLVDNLQALSGIVDPRLDSTSAKDTLGNDIIFTHEYLSTAGYMEIDPLFPLSTTITYQAV